ncbi:MAG TPA: M23 family metallopeptidase [Steroidobacteraceae bacterium]|nr:M23 family metallopeptidase [Steroidobacteraceae bacterium]
MKDDAKGGRRGVRWAAVATAIAWQTWAATAVCRDVDVRAVPAIPTVEQRESDQQLNYDLIVHNRGDSPLRLALIREKVFDAKGHLELEREVSGNGSPPALAILGGSVVAARGYADFFQPFEHYRRGLDLDHIELELVFLNEAESIPPFLARGDAIATIEIRPARPKLAAYCLPLHGLSLVHDGHDLLSHHRRRDLVVHAGGDVLRSVNANLYAYDFVRIDADGQLFHGDVNRKQDWWSFRAQVFAPVSGTAVTVVDGVPDNTFQNGVAVVPSAAEAIDPNGFGNHVVIQAGDGRFSWLLHLEAGTIAVHPGQRVEAGEMIGRIGFSGDALFPHLHYTVTAEGTHPSQGVPSYFRDFRRVGDARPAHDSRQIDTGDIIERTSSPLCP